MNIFPSQLVFKSEYILAGKREHTHGSDQPEFKFFLSLLRFCHIRLSRSRCSGWSISSRNPPHIWIHFPGHIVLSSSVLQFFFPPPFTPNTLCTGTSEWSTPPPPPPPLPFEFPAAVDRLMCSPEQRGRPQSLQQTGPRYQWTPSIQKKKETIKPKMKFSTIVSVLLIIFGCLFLLMHTDYKGEPNGRQNSFNLVILTQNDS